MNPEQQPPGAWYLGGANAASAPGAGFNPQPPLVGWNPQPPLVGLNPQPPLVGLNPQPPLVGWNPQPPYAGWNPQPPASSQALLVGGPWVGLDPAWVYAGGDQALHAQALSRVRSRIVAPEDPRAPPAARGRLRAPVQSQPLWRWARPFRLSAAQAELQGRLVVQGFQVWWVPPPQALPPAGRQAPSLLFTLNPPNAPQAKGATGAARVKGAKGKAPPPFQYDLQIDKVLRAAVEREERLPEILAQANDIGSFFDALTGIARGNAPHLAELMDLVWEVSAQLLMALKHNVAEWRPMQRSARVVPVIVTPGHGSLPSGHATTSVLTSELLATLLKYPATAERRVQLDALARRIAFNRVVAGVHFPMDSAAGHALGQQIAAALAAAATGAALPAPVQFDVLADSELKEVAGPIMAARVSSRVPSRVPSLVSAVPIKTATTAGDTPLFALMWNAASREVAGLRI